MMIGQIEVMKITKIAEGFACWKAAREIGNQASGGIVRSTWKIGSKASKRRPLVPTTIPKDIPTIAARVKPIATRCRDAKICQNKPLFVAPLSKKGLIINSQVWLTTFIGPGRLASGLKENNCHTIRKKPIAMMGATIFLDFLSASKPGRKPTVCLLRFLRGVILALMGNFLVV